MYKTLITAALILANSQLAQARRGGGDDGTPENHRISCILNNTGAEVLSFTTVEGMGEVSFNDVTLKVKSRGDDVGEMNISDLKTGDQVRAKRLEELLKVVLISDENPDAPTIAESATQRGFAQLTITDASSQDQVIVKSQSRRGVSNMEVTMITNENPGEPLKLTCQKIR